MSIQLNVPILTSPAFSCVSVGAFTFAAASVSTSVCGRNDSVSDRLVVSVTINRYVDL